MNEDSGIRRFDMICIGSGPAGENAAVLAAKRGYRVAIVEGEGLPGGAMVNTGTVASKVLRETAILCSSFRKRPVPGIDPEIDRSVSFDQFLARTTLVQIEEHDRIELDLDRADVEVIRGWGRLDGHETVVVDTPDGGQLRLHSPRILLAVGSRPNRPEHLDFDHPAIVDSTGILSLSRMPDSLTVIGGGVIGSEYASIFAQMGVDTTAVESRSTIMRFLDEDCRDSLIDQMEEAGVRFRFSAETSEVIGLDDGRARITFTDGQTHESDVVLWAMGRNGNTNGLGLETIGLQTDKRGLLKVDHTYKTEVPGVWAAGDVIGFPALASTSMEQSRLAVENMFDEVAQGRMEGLLPMGVYTIPAIAAVGDNEEELTRQGHQLLTSSANYRRNARGRMLGDDRGKLKLVFDAESGKLLHTTVVGEDATELIHLGMLMIAEGWTAADIAAAPFNYPSLSELYKTAATEAADRMQRRAAHAGHGRHDRAA